MAILGTTAFDDCRSEGPESTRPDQFDGQEQRPFRGKTVGIGAWT
jgi:hypothetical protein